MNVLALLAVFVPMSAAAVSFYFLACKLLAVVTELSNFFTLLCFFIVGVNAGLRFGAGALLGAGVPSYSERARKSYDQKNLKGGGRQHYDNVMCKVNGSWKYVHERPNGV